MAEYICDTADARSECKGAVPAGSASNKERPSRSWLRLRDMLSSKAGMTERYVLIDWPIHYFRSESYRNRIYLLNWQKSVFLRLPAEIRNIIYKYALGGRRVHIYRVRDLMRRRALAKPEDLPINSIIASYGLDHGTMCKHQIASWNKLLSQATRLENLGLQDHFVHRTSCINTKHVVQEREHCFYSISCGTPALDTGLISTCRAIHEEAALLPYCWNAFVFPTPGNLEDFVRHSLSPPQAAALTRITICIPSVHSLPWTRHYGGSYLLTDRAAQSLSGLRDLALAFSFNSHAGPWKLPILHNLDWAGVNIGPSRSWRASLEKRTRASKLLEHAILQKRFRHFTLTESGIILRHNTTPSRTDRLQYAIGRLRLPL